MRVIEPFCFLGLQKDCDNARNETWFYNCFTCEKAELGSLMALRLAFGASQALEFSRNSDHLREEYKRIQLENKSVRMTSTQERMVVTVQSTLRDLKNQGIITLLKLLLWKAI